MTYPEGENSFKKEAVLSTSPLLRTFIDRNRAKKDPNIWNAHMDHFSEPLQRSIEKKFNLPNSFQDSFVDGFAIIAKHVELFREDLPEEKLNGIIKRLILIGYEIAYEERRSEDVVNSIDMFSEEIYNSLREEGCLNPKSSTIQESKTQTLLLSKTMITFGSSLHLLSNCPTSVPEDDLGMDPLPHDNREPLSPEIETFIRDIETGKQ